MTKLKRYIVYILNKIFIFFQT